MTSSPSSCAEYQRLNRRRFLSAGALTAAGLSLADVLQLQSLAGASAPSKETSVILLWMDGGPSQHDTFDPKPKAPAEIRGEFSTIQSAVPGTLVCEHLPQTAKQIDRVSLVRSLHHTDSLHEGALHWVMTGHGYPGAFNPTDQRHPRNPSMGSIAAHALRDRPGGTLPYVKIFKDGGYAHSYQGAVQLGQRFDPLVIGSDLRSTAFKETDPLNRSHLQPPALSLPSHITLDRVRDRRILLRQLEDSRKLADRGALGQFNSFQEQAFDVLTSRRSQNAFDLSREKIKTRERYGRNLWGQGTLLARRLVEAGVRFVTVNLHGDPPPPLKSQFSWDTHVDHFPAMKNHLLPVFDQLLSALLNDLFERGLSEHVLVVAVGEFGRTPKAYSDGRPGGVGRAHWPHAFSALLAGGGVPGGQVIGSTDAHGAYVKDRPLAPEDLLASIYSKLGIDHHATVTDPLGRPISILPRGEAIGELM